MRLFTLKLRSRKSAPRAVKATAETPAATAKTKSAINYDAMEKAALVRERRSIRMY
jgi:hypothetical protein